MYYTTKGLLLQTVNYEKFPIGHEERAFSFTIKNNNDILGFILCCTIQLLDDPELILQYIVLSPEAQGQGIGKFAVNEILSNPKKYLNSNINRVFANVERTNTPSRKMFESLGFSLNYTNSNYLSARNKNLPLMWTTFIIFKN